MVAEIFAICRFVRLIYFKEVMYRMDILVKVNWYMLLCIFISISVWWMLLRNRLGIKWYQAILLGAVETFFGAVAAKILALAEVGFNLSIAPAVRWYGAVWILPLVAYVLAKIYKKKATPFVDATGVVAAIALICVRVFCIADGCCGGFAVVRGGDFTWPIREVEMLFCLIFILAYWKRVYEGRSFGQVYPMYMISYGIVRFLIEWLRDEFTGNIGIFHLAHIWSVITIVIGAAIYFELKENQKKKSQRRARK